MNMPPRAHAMRPLTAVALAAFLAVAPALAGSHSAMPGLFTVDTRDVAPAPEAAVLVAPSGTISDMRPTLDWNEAANAEWYYVYIAKESGFYFDWWTQDTQFAVFWDLPEGDYTWYVMSWGNGQDDVWSTGMSFTVLITVPDVPTNLQPSGGADVGDNMVEFSWTGSPSAEWYHIWISKDGGLHSEFWVHGTESSQWFHMYEPGAYEWYVRGWSSVSGLGDFSAPASFTVTSLIDVPGLATDLAPAGSVSGDSPVFSWTPGTDTQWNYLWIHKDGQPYFESWVANVAEFATGWGFEDGTYTWGLHGWNQAYELNDGTAEATFTVGGGDAGDYLVIDVSAGPSASSYPVSYLTAVPVGGWTDEYKTTKIVLRRIPAGTFTMGSPTDELGRWDDETQHEVTLTEDFYIGVFEVTQRQWERVTGEMPSQFAWLAGGDTDPVERVGYNDIRGSSAGAGWPADNNVDASSFLGKLRDRTGLMLDLPTESQWEYACRAGTTRAYNDHTKNGGEGADCLTTGRGSDSNLEPLAWYLDENSSRLGYREVGTKQANAWGLYDMLGNVWEWCLDWYGTYPGTVTDPVGASSGSYRVFRGGSWHDRADDCRSAYRYGNFPVQRYNYYGLRVCSAPPGQ